MNARAYPHSLEIERAILAVIMEAPNVLERCPLTPDDFYRPDHQELYSLMRRMYDAGEPPDMVALPMRVGRDENPDRFGGFQYITDLPYHAHGGSHTLFDGYCQQVQEDATRRRLLAALQATEAAFYEATTPVHESLTELDERIEKALAGAVSRASRPQMVGDSMAQLLDRLRNPPKRPTMISTGYQCLDRRMGGLARSTLTVIAAKTGTGKTSFALEVCRRVAQRGEAALVVQTEMKNQECAARTMSNVHDFPEQVAHLDYVDAYTLGQVEAATIDAEGLEVYTLDAPRATVERIVRESRRMAAEARSTGGRLGVVVVDYLQRLHVQQERGESRARALGRASQALKDMAMELDVAVLLLSQPKRTERKITMHDLRDSGEIEEAANNILLLHRHEPPLADVLEVEVAKLRAGQTGSEFLTWSHERRPKWSEPPVEALPQIRRMLGEG